MFLMRHLTEARGQIQEETILELVPNELKEAEKTAGFISFPIHPVLKKKKSFCG